ANPTNRCYFCKSELFDVLVELAKAEGFDAVCDGTNMDDTKEWRPGAQAGAERAIKSPLRDAHLSKADIRELSRSLNLPTWDKPAMPCLSSRIPYGQSVTREALHRIGRAEVFLREKGLREVRVRHYLDGDAPQARIEVAPVEMPTLFGFWNEVGPALRQWGFESVLLDLEGYQRGKMNLVAKVESVPITFFL
ncbi:ATP-dependent sacrificial sulfur transferase LarE, partial [bacterium]